MKHANKHLKFVNKHVEHVNKHVEHVELVNKNESYLILFTSFLNWAQNCPLNQNFLLIGHQVSSLELGCLVLFVLRQLFDQLITF